MGWQNSGIIAMMHSTTSLLRRSLLLRSLSRRELLGTLAAAPLAQAFRGKITKASLSALTDQIGRTQREAIAFAHQYGLRWVELRNVPETKKEITFLPEAEIQALAAELASNKLKVSFLNTSLLKFAWPGTTPAPPKPPVDSKRWANRKADCETAVRAANILGTDNVRVFTGDRVAHPETAFPLIRQTLEELLPIAEKGKVRLVIENEHSQNIGTSAEIKAIMAIIPSKTLGFNWDPGNAKNLGEVTWPEGYALLPKSRMRNVQFKAKNLMNNQDRIDWLNIVNALDKDGYAGRLGLEADTGGNLIEASHDAMRQVLQMVGQL